MEFRILGPLEVVAEDGRLRLGGPKPRAVLAHLVIRANRIVPVDLLVDELWGERLPDNARNAVQTHVSRLRSLLGDDRLEGRPPGYVLHVEAGELDAERFDSALGEARADLAEDPESAVASFEAALSLWRGPALGDLSEEPSLTGEIARLEELRLSALEDKLSAELVLGRHGRLIGELDSLTREHPLRERLWSDLMLALYRSGRQADALDAFRRARQVLADELGIDPSRRLQRLHERILAQDPALSAASRPIPAARPSSAPGELAPDTELAGYRIEDLLGRGGMSTVYLAEDLRLRRRVALKVLSPQLSRTPGFRERFVRESQIAAGIEHPAIVPIYEAGEADGLLYIAMRYVRGTDLHRLLAGAGPLEPDRAVWIVRQVAEALDAAHAEGLVHRDVKPGNILLVPGAGADGRDLVYLSDFGLTKRLEGASGALTATGQFVGTVDYVAPEQIEGKPIDGRADVYSLGCVLFESLTGAAPFRRDAEIATLYAHLKDRPPRPSGLRAELPDDLDGVIATALAKEPSKRFGSGGELASAARRALGSAGEEFSSRAGPLVRAASRPIGIAAIVAIVALVSAGLVFAFTRDEPNGRAGELESTPSPDASPSPDAHFPRLERAATEDEVRLLGLIPGGIRAMCEPAEPGAVTGLPEEVLGAVACDDGDVEVLYELFPDLDTMERALGARAYDMGAFGGNCATDHEAQNPYTVGGEEVGRILCVQRRGRSEVAWTDSRVLVLGHAMRDDAGDLSLYEWWVSAGPVPSDSLPSKDASAGAAAEIIPDGSFAITLSVEDNRRLPPGAPQDISGPFTAGLRLSSGEYDFTFSGGDLESGVYILSKEGQIVFETRSSNFVCTTAGTATYDWSVTDGSIEWMFDARRSEVTPGGQVCVPGPWPFLFRPWVPAPTGQFVMDGGGDLFLRGADGFDTIRLEQEQAETHSDSQPAWSPDGDRVVFVSDRSSVAGAGITSVAQEDLFVMDADGSHITPLTSDEGNELDPAWSPDGALIAFHTDHVEDEAGAIVQEPCDPELCDTVSTLSLVAPDGTGRVDLVERRNQDVRRPAWSPDGTTIVFLIDGSLHLIDADGIDLREVRGATGEAPTWTPDGERIVYWDLGDEALISVRPDGTGARPFTLTPETSGPVAVAWSPDGRWIVQGGLVEGLLSPVTVTSADGTETFYIASAASEPRWRPEP